MVQRVVITVGQQILLRRIMALLLALETMLRVLLVEIRLVNRQLPVIHSK